MPDLPTDGDFAEAGPRFSMKSREPDILAAWQKHLPFTPKGLLDAICNGPLENADLHVDMNETGYTKLKITLRNGGGEEELYCLSAFDPGGDLSELINVRVAPHLQGRGLARLAVKNSFTVARKMGITCIRIQATLANGGYTWARLGFKPRAASWHFLRENFLEGRLETFRACMPGFAHAQLEAAVKSDNPESIWLIAAMKTPAKDVPLGRWLLAHSSWSPDDGYLPAPNIWNMVRKTARDRLENMAGNLSPDVCRHVQELLSGTDPRNATAIVELPARISGIPLGQLMLTGTDWRGELDFDNPAQATIYRAYVEQEMSGAPAAKPPAPMRRPRGPHG